MRSTSICTTFVAAYACSVFTLHASAKPKASPKPGRSALPIAHDGVSKSSSKNAGFSMKLKPIRSAAQTNALPKKLPAKQTRTIAATKAVNLNEPVTNFLRTIRVGAQSPRPQLASGSALAVHGSYLVSSADFVTDVWTNSGDVKFYLGDKAQPIELVGLDLASNVAIFTTGLNTQMERTLPLERLRTEPGTANEDYVVLTASGLASGAHHSTSVADLSMSRERLDLPMSVASSGVIGSQFLFDRGGRWMGQVSSLDQREGRRFDSTSATVASDLIRQLEKHPPRALTRAVLQDQISSWQERWTNMFYESAKKGVALRNLNCAAEPLKIADTAVASEVARTRLVYCHNTIPVSLTRDYSLGFEFVTGEINFANDVKTFLSRDSSPMTAFASAFSSTSRAPASINLMTSPECEKSDVTNGRGHHYHVRFCTSALKNASAMNDTTMTMISSDTGVKATVNSIHLRGFDTKNAKRFMQWLIESEVVQ